MTKSYTSFEDDALGGIPSTWSRQWAAIADATFLYTLRNGSPAVKRRYLDTAQTNATDGALNAGVAGTNVDILSLYYVETANPDSNALIPARASGGAGSEQCYALDLGVAGGYLQIGRVVAGAFTALPGSTAFTATPGTWYFLRFRVQGTGATVTLTASAWAAGTPAALATTVTVNDTSGSRITTSGWAGLWNFGANGNGRWNFFSFADGGAVAVTPLLNTEFSAWLDEPHERRYLADMSMTGFNPFAGAPPYHVTRHVYIANGGFITKEQDTPTLRHYSPWMSKPPSFSREMSVANSGVVKPSFGTMSVSNGRPTGTTPSAAGERDDWLRMKWIRNYITVRLGDPDWPRHDFRVIIMGRLEQPTGPADRIDFGLKDMLDALDVPVSTSRFSAGPFDGQLKPRLFGRPALIEPPLTDEATGEFTIDNGSITEPIPPVRAYQEGVALESVAGLTVSAVSIGTETLTASANHGFATNWRVRFGTGTPPTGLSLNTDYYVIAAGLTAADFRLSATVGGAAINITVGTTGAGFMGYANRFDLAAGKMYVAGNLSTGRIMVGEDTVDGGLEDDAGISSEYLLANIYDQLIFGTAGVSRDLKDDDSFAALAAASTGKCGLYVQTQPVFVSEAVARVMLQTLSFVTQAPHGLVQAGLFGLPAATSVMDFTESQVTALELQSIRRPMNYNNVTIKYRPRFFASGPMQSTDPAFNAEWLLSASLLVTPTVPPLDQIRGIAEEDEGAVFESLHLDRSEMGARVTALYLLLLGVFRFKTKIRAIELSIGETISLTHSRMGWKNWTGSDDPSPDNTGTFDGRLAVVIGHAFDPNDDSGFPVTLTVMRQIPGYYPTADLN